MKSIRQWIIERPVPNHKRPVFLFGLFIVLHGGKWADIRLPGGWLVICWRRGHRWAYYSPDATPTRAKWGLGRFNN